MGLFLHELMIGPPPDLSDFRALSRRAPKAKKAVNPMEFYKPKAGQTAAVEAAPKVAAADDAEMHFEAEEGKAGVGDSDTIAGGKPAVTMAAEEANLDFEAEEGEEVIGDSDTIAGGKLSPGSDVSDAEDVSDEEPEDEKEEVAAPPPKPAAVSTAEPTIGKADLEQWFPEPKDKNSVEYGIWRMLQPFGQRATGSEVLGIIDDSAAAKFASASPATEVIRASQNKKFDFAAQRYLQLITNSPEHVVTVSQSIEQQFRAPKKGLFKTTPGGPQSADVDEWNKAVVEQFGALPDKQRENFKIRVRKGTNILECYKQESRLTPAEKQAEKKSY